MRNSIEFNFIESTQNVDMHQDQDRFLRLLDEDASILDFGCGSGRDTRYFLDKGYQVTATDGSAEICRLASSFTGIAVKEILFGELDDINTYDGIWVCSSILHLPKNELLLPEKSKKNKAVRVLKAPKTDSSVQKVFLPKNVALLTSLAKTLK